MCIGGSIRFGTMGIEMEKISQLEPLWVTYEQEMRVLSDYAGEFRYPGTLRT